MKKIDLILGFIIGLIGSFVGTYFFLTFFSEYNFYEGLLFLKSSGQLGKLITIGSVLNIGIFFLLLKFKKELMARGIILALILMAVFTIFI